MPGAGSPDPEYIAARRVLLDSLEALGTHRKAVVLVGAQARHVDHERSADRPARAEQFKPFFAAVQRFIKSIEEMRQTS